MNKEFDPTKPVQTRDGRKARILCTDAAGSSFPVVALVTCCGGGEVTSRYTLSGMFYNTPPLSPDVNDLVNIPVAHTQEFWANCYPAGAPITHDSKETARRCASGNCIATIKVTLNFKEGDGL